MRDEFWNGYFSTFALCHTVLFFGVAKQQDRQKIGGNMKKEMWAYIDSFHDYMISNRGRVYSTKREIVLSQNINNKGYCRVSLKHIENGVNLLGKRQYLVHVLVVKAFGDKRKQKYNQEYNIDHVDGNKQNNTIENLELVSHSENMLRYYERYKHEIEEIF